MFINFINFFSLLFQNKTAFQNQPLSAINQDVIQAANMLTNVGKKEVECLKQLAECKGLINWVRQEIKGQYFI